MPQYTPGVILIWGIAGTEARGSGHGSIEPVHLMLALAKLCGLSLDQLKDAAVGPEQVLASLETDTGELRRAFDESGVEPIPFRRRLRAVLARGSADASVALAAHRSPHSRKVFARAERIAGATALLRPIHLLAALLELDNPPWAEVLADMHVAPAELALAAQRCLSPGAAAGRPDDENAARPAQGDRKVKGLGKFPVLDKFGRDLSRLAAEGKLDPVIGRRHEMRMLAQILVQKRKHSAVLVGEAGVGKTGIVEGLAQRITSPKPPAGLEGRRIVEITMAALVAGTKYRGEFEARVQALVSEATSDPNLILFIDEIHTLMQAGGEGASDAANILKPALARGDLSVIGATTVAEYRKYIEKDAALERRFQVVWVDEPSREEAIEILRGLRTKFEEHHELAIADVAIEAAVELAIRYLPDLRLPDKAIDLIDQACAQARLATMSRYSDAVDPKVRAQAFDASSFDGHVSALFHAAGVIGRSDIARVVADRCRIPVDRLTANEAERLLRMEEVLAERVIGQDEAVRTVADVIRTARSGLKNPKRPVGVFLFIGSTGTGKTELAKALDEFLFGDERRMIGFDMSEYMEEHSVAKLIGAPPGYVGHDQEGLLTGSVRSNPYSVVLFDEIEKAHPRVLDLFLQILDEGRLTDSKGRRASFTEAVIIMTSNLGSGLEQEAEPAGPFGFAARAATPESPWLRDHQVYCDRIMAAVRQALRPELLNRIDHCVFFYPLPVEVVRQIIDKMIAGVRHERLAQHKIELALAPDVYELLMHEGYNPVYGAREMARVIERRIVQPLGKAILEGKFRNGDHVHVAVSDGSITFSKWRDDWKT